MASFTALVSRLALSLVFTFQILEPAAPLAPANEWSEVNRPSAPGGIILAIAQSPSDSDILYSLVDDLQGSRLYKSVDRSGAWTFIYQFSAHMSEFGIDPGDAEILYAGSAEGLFRATDGGFSWEKISNLAGPFAAPVAGRVYLIGKSTTTLPACLTLGFVFSWSNNGGTDWNTTDLGCFTSINRMAVVDGNPDVIYAVANVYTPPNPFPVPYNTEYLVRSRDGGQTWESFEMPSDYRCPACSDLAIDPADPQHLFGNVDAFFISSPDGGETWEANYNYNLGVNCDIGCDLRLAVSGGKIFALPLSTLSQPVYFSEDGGKNWFQSIKNLPSGVFAFTPDCDRAEWLFAGTIGYGIFRTEDAGATWLEANQGIQTLTRVSALVIAPSNPDVFYAASDYPRQALFASQDGGQTWSPPLLDQLYESPFFQAGIDASRIKKIVIHPQNPEIVWAGGDDGLFYTSEYGNYWSKFGYAEELWDLKVSASFPEQPYAILQGDSCLILDREPDFTGMFYTWTKHVMTNMCGYTLAINPSLKGSVLVAAKQGTLFGPITNGIFSSDDSGKTFQKIGEIDTEATINDLEFFPSNSNLILAAIEPLRDLSNQVMISRDGGATWNSWSEGLDRDRATYHSNLEMDPVHNIAYFWSMGVYSRSFTGSQWQLIGFEGEEILALSRSTQSPQFLLASTANGLWKLDLFAHTTWLPVVTK